MTCPICLKTAEETKSWVQCRRYGGMPVCMRHCLECEYLSGFETSLWHCFYGKKIGKPNLTETEKTLDE